MLQNLEYWKELYEHIPLNSLHYFDKKDGHTSHQWRRSAAINLVDTGMLFINLRWHSQWNSDCVAEGVKKKSKPLPKQRLNCLLPEKQAKKK